MTTTVTIIEEIKDLSEVKPTQTEKSLMERFGLKLSDLPFDKIEVGQSFKINADIREWSCDINTINSAARMKHRKTGKKFKCRYIYVSGNSTRSGIECTRVE